jgi:mono/diheme cytochrome c family protein
MRASTWAAGIFTLAAAACTSSGTTSGTGGMGGAGGACPNDLPASCPANAPGYEATIAPIFAEHCVGCHSPGGTGSKQLLGTYADVYENRGSVLDQVYACRMPPSGSGLLTLAQRDEILAWLVCGAHDD